MENPFEILENRLIRIENLLMKMIDYEKKPENKIYSVKELSALSGLSQLSIRNYIKQGKIKAKRIGRRILIDQSQFENGLVDVKSLKYTR